MQLSSPIEALSRAIHHAELIGLPDVPHRVRDYEAMEGWSQAQRYAAIANGTMPYIEAVRRPHARECEVVAMFAQTWGSTALGFGGVGGAAMTPAYTVVVRGPDGALAVYWAGSFAYLIPAVVTPSQRQAFAEDLMHGGTVGRGEAGARYGAVHG